MIILITFQKLHRSFHLVANDDAVPARGAPVLAILRRAITAVITIAAAGPTTVETNALALACDAVALARAVGAVGPRGAVSGHAAVGAGAVGAVRQGRAAGRHGRLGQGAEVCGDVLGIVGVVLESCGAEAVREVVDGLVRVFLVQDVLVSSWRHGLWGLDLRDGQGAALWHVDGQGSPR